MKSQTPTSKASALKASVRAATVAPDTRSAILEMALRMVRREGLEGLTIGELAKAVGMSKSGLFAHFGGKDQLQLSVMNLAVERFVDLVFRPSFKELRGEPRILAMFDNWLAHLNDDEALPGGSVLIAASTELDDRPGSLRDFVQNAQRDLIKNIEKAAAIAVEEGHFRPDLDVELFAWSMYSFVLGYHHFNRMLEDPKAETHMKRSFLGLLDVARGGRSAEARAGARKPKGKTPAKRPRKLLKKKK